MLIVCENCGYTEYEYKNLNTVDFNNKMAKYLSSKNKSINNANN